MTVETDLVTLISATFSGRVYADFAPAGTVKPYATYQQIGGSVVDFVENTDPQYSQARIQINVWATTRNQANTLMRTVAGLLRPAPFGARPIGALIARVDETAELRGAQQDFSIWHST